MVSRWSFRRSSVDPNAMDSIKKDMEDRDDSATEASPLLLNQELTDRSESTLRPNRNARSRRGDSFHAEILESGPPVSIRIFKGLESLTSGKSELDEKKVLFDETDEDMIHEIASTMPMIPHTESTAHVHFVEGKRAVDMISAITCFVLIAVAMVIVSGLTAL